MDISLFDFQAEDVDKLKSKRSRLVGNDPGTGKTYVGIALDQLNREGDGNAKVELPRVKKTLVVAPKSVLSTWDEHCMKLTSDDVFVYDDEGKQPAKAREIFLRDLCNPKYAGYFITHWESLRNLEPVINKKKILFTHIIADEVHRAKNKKAQQTVALKKLQTWYKSGLSGTPADNKPQDLWSILNWLWPNYYTSYWHFVKAYLMWETTEEGYKKILGPNPETIGMLRKEMAPWYTRRRKEDVLPDLPPKYYSRVWVNLGTKQRTAYDQMRKTMMAWVEEHGDELSEPMVAQAVVAQLTRLQQFADGYMVPLRDPETGEQVIKRVHKGHLKGGECTEKCRDVPQWKMEDPSAKLDALMDILADRMSYDKETDTWGGEQIVVFSVYKQAIKSFEQRLIRKGIPHGIYTGDTSATDRTKIRHAFQNGDLRVFAGTIKAGGVGLTLTAGTTVVFIDRDWSPSSNGQAEDRLHRIGQQGGVQVIDIMARNTVDMGKKQQLTLKQKHLAMLLGDVVLPDIIVSELEKEEALDPNKAKLLEGITEMLGDDTALEESA